MYVSVGSKRKPRGLDVHGGWWFGLQTQLIGKNEIIDIILGIGGCYFEGSCGEVQRKGFVDRVEDSREGVQLLQHQIIRIILARPAEVIDAVSRCVDIVSAEEQAYLRLVGILLQFAVISLQACKGRYDVRAYVHIVALSSETVVQLPHPRVSVQS